MRTEPFAANALILRPKPTFIVRRLDLCSCGPETAWDVALRSPPITLAARRTPAS